MIITIPHNFYKNSLMNLKASRIRAIYSTDMHISNENNSLYKDNQLKHVSQNLHV